MQVSIFAAFVAGLISFLSPCVLPLVPGYISMLSGIGVEQLRQGERPRGSLLTSAFAFVVGFSVVFIAFGASASAVGQFLLQNKSLLAPFAGAVILLFGLHLIGWLGRIPVRVGLVVGGLLVVAGVIVWLRFNDQVPAWFGGAQLVSVSLIFLLGPSLTRLAQSRHPFPQPGRLEGCGRKGRCRAVRGSSQRVPAGLRVCLWVDAVHWADSRGRAGHGRDQRYDWARGIFAGDLLGGPGDSFPADGAGHQPVFGILPAVPALLADGGGFERRSCCCSWAD